MSAAAKTSAEKKLNLSKNVEKKIQIEKLEMFCKNFGFLAKYLAEL